MYGIKETYDVYENGTKIIANKTNDEICEMLGCNKNTFSLAKIKHYKLKGKYEIVPACKKPKYQYTEDNDYIYSALMNYGNTITTDDPIKVCAEMKERGVNCEWEEIKNVKNNYGAIGWTAKEKKAYLITEIRETKKEKWWWQK